MINEPSHARSQRIATAALPVRRWVERRHVVLGAAAVLFCAVFALRWSFGDPADGVTILYVVPIALVGLELGLMAGLAAAALAFVLLVVWALDVHLGVVGVATRGFAYFSVGGVVGRFSDRMRDAQRRQTQLLASGSDLAHLTAGDELAAMLARHARALVRATGAHVRLAGRPDGQTGSMEAAYEEIPIAARGARQGTLTVAGAGTLAPEDRAALGILALQGAVADDNQRLLDSERERAAIRAELYEADRRLAERGEQMRELLAGQEAERREVSHQLHEQAAQTLAAVLMGLGALERRLGSELGPVQVGALRSHVDGTMRSLRALAESLRPPSLELGLKAALERLAQDTREHGPVALTVELGASTGLDPDAETMIYRVVEEALSAGGDAASSLTVSTRAAGRELVIVLESPGRPIAPERLATLRARLELVGGTLTATPGRLHAVIPIAAPRAPAGAVST